MDVLVFQCNVLGLCLGTNRCISSSAVSVELTHASPPYPYVNNFKMATHFGKCLYNPSTMWNKARQGVPSWVSLTHGPLATLPRELASLGKWYPDDKMHSDYCAYAENRALLVFQCIGLRLTCSGHSPNYLSMCCAILFLRGPVY